MSLRDQLLAKGLASKKDARRVQRELKKDRLDKKGNQKRKNVLKREQEAAAKAAADAKAERVRLERTARNQARDRYEQALRVRNLLLGNQVRNKGDYRFHFRSEAPDQVRYLSLQRKVAQAVVDGQLAIAWLDQGNRIEYVLVNADTAAKLLDIGAAHVVLHWSKGEKGVDEALWQRDWEPSLRPHRQR